MAKTSKQTQKNSSNVGDDTSSSSKNGPITKGKRTRKTVPRESPQPRSSIYRGVTRHRWTGRYEAHLWDKNCWNESQNKKGRQVYLGAYDDEEAAAHAYDLAALKYWGGQDTILNFPLSTYERELKEMEGQSKEEYIGSLRRKSSGFSRGVSKYRGVARHHHNGRWEARIGRVFGNKYLYLGTYATQEEAATAYDMAAIEYRGLNAVTNFDLSRYIKWIKPNQGSSSSDTIQLSGDQSRQNPNLNPLPINPSQDVGSSSSGETIASGSSTGAATSALELLLQSSKFKEMLERTAAVAEDSPSTPSEQEQEQEQEPEPEPQRRCFPDDIQTYFDCQEDSSSFGDDHDNIFGDFASAMFPCEL